jgi:putative tricarboxylic transport membrane protein
VPKELTPRRTAERRTLPTDGREVERGSERAGVARERKMEVREPDRRRGALLRELVPELALLGGAVYLFVVAGDFTARQQPGQLGPAFWPRLAAVGLAVALLVRIFQTVRAHGRPVVREVSEFDDIGGEPARVHWRSAAIAMGLAFGYVLATMFLGYMFATIAFLGAFIWFGGQRTWHVPLVAVAGGLLMTYVFVGVVYVSVPTGVGVFDTITVAFYELVGIQ